MPKISRDGVVSYEPGREPEAVGRQEAGMQAEEHPGHGEEIHGAEHPADGAMSPPVSNDEPEAAEPAHAPVAPPRRPPRSAGA